MIETRRGSREWSKDYIVASSALLVVAVIWLGAATPPWWTYAVLGAAAAMVLVFGVRARRAQVHERDHVVLAEQKEKASRTILGHVFDSVLDPMLAIDERGLVVAANPSVERVFGWTRDQVVGHNVNMLMGEPYRTEHDRYIEHYLETGERRAIGRIRKVLGRARDGREFPCELSVSEVWTDAGRTFFGVVRDVSEHENFAVRMATAERLAAVGEVAAGIAHEVNNPVNTIINCAKMIKDGDSAPELCDYVLQEGLRIAAFVRELMGVAQDRGDDFKEIDVHEPLRRAVSLLGIRLRHAGVEVVVAYGADLPPIRARSHRLQQVFLNLLINALDALRAFERAGKRVDVRTRLEVEGGQRFVVVSIEDNGPGVQEYARERIFQPFFTTKKVGEGTGLGLAVSAGIVRDHGGRIVLRSEVGQPGDPASFSEFAVWLPVAP